MGRVLREGCVNPAVMQAGDIVGRLRSRYRASTAVSAMRRPMQLGKGCDLPYGVLNVITHHRLRDQLPPSAQGDATRMP